MGVVDVEAAGLSSTDQQPVKVKLLLHRDSSGWLSSPLSCLM